MESPLVVPELVKQRAAALGAAGAQWLDELPDLVAALSERWGLRVGASMSGGTASYVAAATDRSGRACVLKVAMPSEFVDDDTFARSVLVHQLAGGRACAELLEHDPSSLAMVLERLGPNLDDLALPLPDLLATIAATLRAFWRPVDVDCGLPTGPEKAEWLAGYITASWDELDRPCPRAVVDRAVDYCAARVAAFDPTGAVLVHGDAHGWNTLATSDGGFKFVDPEGLRSEPAHDLSVPMREYNEALLAGATARLTRERAEVLGTLCDVDPERVWQWGFIERVSTGLANVRDFEGTGGMEFLEVAERCL
jgi:streptomycin 6-kinase